MKENMKENMEEAIDEVDYSDVGSEALYEYITSLIVQVTHELSDDVENIDWSMDDDTVTIEVTFKDGSKHSFDFDQYMFMMNKYYISTDIDMIVDEVEEYIKLHDLQDEDEEEEEWEYYGKKSVKDSDGFWTDYTMWHNLKDDTWACYFGDSDIYTPENSSPDAEFDTKEECQEWFDDYRGFEEDDEWEYEEDSEVESSESLKCSQKSMNATEVVIWLYDEFPDWAFIDEKDEGDKVHLIFEAKIKDREALENALRDRKLKYKISNKLHIWAPEASEYEEVQGSQKVQGSTLADLFEEIHDKDEYNWNLHSNNYEPFYNELKMYMKKGETWDLEDSDGYPLDTNVTPRQLFERMPRDKQIDFMDRFYISKKSENVHSSEEFFDKGDGQTYWYMTHHGVQPGSVPRGINILEVIDTPEGSFFKTDRVITTKALKYYDIKEKAPKGYKGEDEEVESCSTIQASAVRTMSPVKDKIVSAIRDLKAMKSDASLDIKANSIDTAIDFLKRAYGVL